MILFFWGAEEESIFGETERGECGDSIEILYFDADYLFFISFCIAENELYFEKIA